MDKKQLRTDVAAIAVPALVELLLIQLCTMVDMMMVGRLGSWALASVGYTTQPKFLLLATFVALNSGVTALVARFRGAEDKLGARQVMNQSLSLTCTLAIVISIIGSIFSPQMIAFMGADTELTLASGTSYMRIQMVGFTFNALTLTMTAGLRGIGKTKVSMVYNLTANIVNVIFNYLLIYGKLFFPEMGVAGASIATVIGQTVAFVMAAYVLSKDQDYLSIKIKLLLKPNFSIIKRILNIGAPAMGEQVVMRAGMLIYTLTVTSLGEELYATHQAASSILTMSFMNGQAFGISAASLLGRSLGRGDPEMGKAYVKQCQSFAMISAVFLALGFFFLGGPIMHLYTDEAFVIAEGAKVLMVVAFLQPLQASQLVLNGALRGAGDTRLVAVITFIGILVIRPITSYVFVSVFGLQLMGAWMAMVLDQSTRSIFSFFRFRAGKWAAIKV